MTKPGIIGRRWWRVLIGGFLQAACIVFGALAM